MTRILLLCGLLAGCDSDTASPNTPDTRAACQSCLDDGGTWQPEADECTQDCALMDISCYTDSCPEECSSSTCECFSQEACESAGCTWSVESEAMWCG